MKGLRFQWNPTKAATNYLDHGITFEAAEKAFADDDPLEWLDDREDYGEDRWIRIAGMEGRILFLVYLSATMTMTTSTSALFRPERPARMSRKGTGAENRSSASLAKAPRPNGGKGWDRLDAMTPQHKRAAAENDPDCPP